MVAPLRTHFGRRTSYQWTWKFVVVVMLGNTGRSRMVRSKSPWTSLWFLLIWTIWKSHLHNQTIICEDQEGYQDHYKTKGKKKSRYVITNVSLKYLSRIIKKFQKLPYEGYVQKRSKHESTDSYFNIVIQLDNCMMRLNLHIGPVKTQRANMKKMNNSEMSM